MVRTCAGKGRRNGPCQDSLGLQHVIEHRRPDVVVLDKHEKMCHLKEIGTSVRVELLQKAALLWTARILRKTLEI